MELNNQIVNQIFFSNILNKDHLNKRKWTYARLAITKFYYLFYFKIYPNKEKLNISLIFVFYHQFDKNQIRGYENTKKLNKHLRSKYAWLFEEYLISLAFFAPPSIRYWLAKIILKRIEKKLNNLNVIALLSDYPSILISFIGLYLKSKVAKTFILQHGIYIPDYYENTYYEKFIVDYNLVWGNVFNRCFLNNGIKEESIKVINAPFRVSEQKKMIIKVKPLFLGQQLYKILPHVKNEYNHYIKKLIDLYEKHDIQLIYKPHPREDVRLSLSEENRLRLSIEIKKNVSDQYFKDITHAFSVNSTSLIMALCNKVKCYQVPIDLKIPELNYSRYSNIQYINFLKTKDLLSYEQKDVKTYIKKDFLNIDKNYIENNTELINSIIEDSVTP